MMARRALVVSILLVVASFGLRCGSSTTTTTTAQIGSVFTLIGDTPVCDVLAARFNITQLSLKFSGSSAGVALLSPLSTLIPIDLAGLQGSSTVLNNGRAQTGSYDRLILGVDVASMYVYDPSASPPIRSLTETLATPSPLTYTISPPLVVPANHAAVVSLDFDLQHSVEVNSQGQITGAINPLATATAPTVSTTGAFGEIDGTEGFVESIQNTAFIAGGVNYLGALTVQLLPSNVSGAGGTALAAELTPNSALCGPTTFSNQACCASGVTGNPACSVPQTPLNGVLTGSYAAVDGFIDNNAEFEATSVSLGPQEVVANQQVAFIGPILSVAKDISGNITGFNMFLRQIQPPVTVVPLDALTSVTISSGTLYNTMPPPIYTTSSASNPQGANFAALPFGSDQIAVGEDVVVHGVYTVPPVATPPAAARPVSMVANEVDLKLQTHLGNFVSLVSAQSDNRTGAFTLQPCAMLDQQDSTALPIYVFTSSQTVFRNLPGLSSLQTQPTLVVRGLLFYEPQGAVINGVTVPAGKMVMLAKQITQTT
jgi:hypothetical protein